MDGVLQVFRMLSNLAVADWCSAMQLHAGSGARGKLLLQGAKPPNCHCQSHSVTLYLYSFNLLVQLCVLCCSICFRDLSSQTPCTWATAAAVGQLMTLATTKRTSCVLQSS